MKFGSNGSINLKQMTEWWSYTSDNTKELGSSGKNSRKVLNVRGT